APASDGAAAARGAPGMNEGAGDVWRVATRQLPYRIDSALLLNGSVSLAPDGAATAPGYGIARFRHPWLQRANAAHPCAACAIPPRFCVFRRFGVCGFAFPPFPLGGGGRG